MADDSWIDALLSQMRPLGAIAGPLGVVGGVSAARRRLPSAPRGSEGARADQQRLAEAAALIAARMPAEYQQAGDPDTFGLPEYAVNTLGNVMGYPTPIATTMFNRVRVNPDWLTGTATTPRLTDTGLRRALIHEYTHVGQSGTRSAIGNMRPSTKEADERDADAAHGRYQPRTSDIALQHTEAGFRAWYARMAKKHDLDPNPDADGQFYDYRRAYVANAAPDASGHWPSDFKRPGHPNEVVGGFNTRTGERVPGTRQASEQELIALGWDAETARELTRRHPQGRR